MPMMVEFLNLYTLSNVKSMCDCLSMGIYLIPTQFFSQVNVGFSFLLSETLSRRVNYGICIIGLLED